MPDLTPMVKSVDEILNDTDFDPFLKARVLPVLHRVYRAGQWDEMMGLSVSKDPWDRATYVPFRDEAIEERLSLAGLALRSNGPAGFYILNRDPHPED